MVKTRTEYDPEYANYFTAVIHYGDPGPVYPNAFHIVYAYSAFDLPMWVDGWHVHETFEAAFLEAQSWVALPALAQSICKGCRYFNWGPSVPRWNIYRGIPGRTIPPTILWNFWDGPPPWPPTP